MDMENGEGEREEEVGRQERERGGVGKEDEIKYGRRGEKEVGRQERERRGRGGGKREEGVRRQVIIN